MENVTALMCCYKNTDPDRLQSALQSLHDQTYSCSDLIVVLDGPVSDLTNTTLTNFQKHVVGFSITLLNLPENVGLGRALAHGVAHAKGDWILRMDDDDISLPDRLERQMAFLSRNPNIDVSGGHICEIDADGAKIGIRKCPLDHRGICDRMMWRNGMNHVSVVLRRDAVLAAGNYQDNHIGYEDYELWVRMMLNGGRFANDDSVYVDVLFDQGQMARRRGLDACFNEMKFQTHIYKLGFTSPLQFLINMVTRSLPRLLPAAILFPLSMLITRVRS